VTAAAPPFFIWHTAEDPYVPVEHSYRLAAALAAQNVRHAVHVFSKGPHSLGLDRGAGEPSAWTELAEAWLTARLDPVTSRPVTRCTQPLADHLTDQLVFSASCARR
jgi:acetyl esterase/lipase